MKGKEIVILFSVLMVFVLLISGQMNPLSAEEKVLIIGTTEPLSGPAAAWGLGLARMNDFFAEDANKAGGLKIGKDIHKLKTVAYDNKGMPSEAAANATKLVSQDKIQ